MWPSSSLLLPSLALQFAAANAQALATVTYGPSGPCPVPSVTSVVVVQAAYYSSVFQSASQIVNLFGNGDTVTIQNAPTTYITNTYITTTIISTVTSVVPSTTSTSPSSAPSSSASVSSVTTSATSASSPSTSVSLTPTSASSTTSSGISTTSTTVFTPIPPPVTTPTPPPVLTSTSVDAQGNTILVPITQPPLVLGEGLPSGTVTDLPASSAVIVGVALGGVGGAKVKRQAAGSQASELLSGNDGGSSGACDVAVRYYLQHGQLTDGTDVVGRNTTDSYALMTPDPDSNNVTTVFSFVDGILHWDSTDQGAATFYRCGDNKVWAGFPSPPRPDCYNVTLGGIVAAACPVPYRDPDATISSTSISSSTSTSADVATTTSERSKLDGIVTNAVSFLELNTSRHQLHATDYPADRSPDFECATGNYHAHLYWACVVCDDSDKLFKCGPSTVKLDKCRACTIKLDKRGARTIKLDKYNPCTVKLVEYCHHPVKLHECCSSAIQQHVCCGFNDTGWYHLFLGSFLNWGYQWTCEWIKHYVPRHSKYKPEQISIAFLERTPEYEQSGLDDFSRYSVFLSFFIHFCPQSKHNILVPRQQLYSSDYVVLSVGSWHFIVNKRSDNSSRYLLTHDD
ncbi:uncharacterized protein A1O5_03265 [Cladophialophora psammophila CBS 110553]|uniref:DUF7908 domain-containing protein n=1 Tax=Cladophialophora psammophila CBS 110553 TaxID=1182543 RepID=W9XT93_9EURO|nr:uncharacterized protein A1O5_03265 [Cladophialophora psammophila CBS 110553]EXJ73504.1 hypothetical protein A1O5_03265 [Cladophialophora psammophila CBS 110553]